MTKNKNNMAKISNIICVVMMLVFMVSLFVTPFWSYTTIEGIDKTAALIGLDVGEGTEVEVDVSLGDYLWFTEQHEDLFGKWKNVKEKGNLKDFDGNYFYQAEIVEMPFMATLLCVFGIFFCLWKMNATWTCVFPAGAGICMLIGLFTSPMLKTGEGWLVLVITSALMILAAAYLLIQWGTTIYKWFTVKKRHY